jgi:hypothetical protein
VTAAHVLLASAASADEASQTCDVPHDLDRYKLLRRLSLDLRGTIPSVEEYESLDPVADIDGAIAAFVAEDGFRTMMRRYHEAMLWPNIGNVNLHSLTNQLFGGAKEALTYHSNSRAKTYRGSPDAVCGDFAQELLGYEDNATKKPKYNTLAGGIRQEGWREIIPYWGGPKIKVCAFDAQETEVSSVIAGAACSSVAGQAAIDCGCGKDLRYCFYGKDSFEPIYAALREQLGRAVDDVVAGGAPYTDLLLSTKAYVNGPIAFWKRNLAPGSSWGGVGTYNIPDPQEEVPATLGWNDTDDWVQVDRNGLHAGILTLPIYLLRFQTGRGRANRFRIDFMCKTFLPPADIETPESGCDPVSSDLTKRCTCRYCHEELEQKTASFGLFAEAGTTSMFENNLFPVFDEFCKGKQSGFCGRFYVTSKSDPRAGYLLPYRFTDVHADYVELLEAGPRELAKQIIEDGTFAQCTVRRVFAHFVKREMRTQAPTDDESLLLGELANAFAVDGYSFPELVRSVVSLPQYRRIH